MVAQSLVSLGNLAIERGTLAQESSDEQAAKAYHVEAEGHMEAARVLLEHKADTGLCDQQGCSPLFFAALNGNVQMVQLLLENGADIENMTSRGHTPLMIAENFGHEEVAALLREHGAT